MGTWILRLGHRPARDERLTTHICLVARALGAEGLYLSVKDSALQRRVTELVARFGGQFQISTGVAPRPLLRRWPGRVVHLTMYGVALNRAAPRLRRWVARDLPLLVVVGSAKVPAYVYEGADLNVAVGHQPHSEAAALALLLDRLHPGWEGADPVGQVTVVDSPEGKAVGRVPDPRECRLRLQEAQVPAWVVGHSREVAALSLEVARRIRGARQGLVVAGGWLHDWGRADSQAVNHCHHSARRAAAAGYHPALQHILASHIGGGLTKAEARRFGLPAGDYLPRTLEAQIVAGCDNLLNGQRRRTIARSARALHRAGHNQGADRMLRLHRRLCRLAGVELETL